MRVDAPSGIRHDALVANRVDPSVVVSNRREAVVYLCAQALLLAAVVVLLSSFVITPAWKPLVVGMALGFPAQLARTYLARRLERRLGELPRAARWQGWWQGQLDHPSVVRHAFRLVGRRL